MTAVVWVCITVMALCLLSILALIFRVQDRNSKAVLGDMVFYSMVAIFLAWALLFYTSITYEVALLSGLLGGLSTLAIARIISRGRR